MKIIKKIEITKNPQKGCRKSRKFPFTKYDGKKVPFRQMGIVVGYCGDGLGLCPECQKKQMKGGQNGRNSNRKTD